MQKSTASPGWGHFGTNPKILESLEGPEGYLCPGIHILGIISICGKPFYTSDEGLLIFFKSQLQNFCYLAELHATLPHCEGPYKTNNVRSAPRLRNKIYDIIKECIGANRKYRL